MGILDDLNEIDRILEESDMQEKMAWLWEVCLAYDRNTGSWPETQYEGLSVLMFAEMGNKGEIVYHPERVDAWKKDLDSPIVGQKGE